MPRSATPTTSRIVLAAVAFVVLAISITTRPPKWLNDFDQSFYLTIAYDIDRYGVFSNGIFDKTDSTRTAPAPGMFFGPGYPLLVLAAMKIDWRFAKAVECSVDVNHNRREGSECEVYATPIHIIHAVLLALGVLAVALCGDFIFGSTRVFWFAGALATGSLTAEADIFSFVMTESLTFSLYSIVMLFAVLAWKRSRTLYWVLAGVCLGLLCLTRPSFVILIPVLVLLIALRGRRLAVSGKRPVWRDVLAFTAAAIMVIGPWVIRNHVSVGKWGLTEEYGSAVLIERFAYNDMTAREFVTAFPYCTPGLGDLAFDQIHGKDSMHRFVYHTRDSFFHTGRGRRDALVKEHGRLDPLIAGIVLDEMRTNWWRHLLVSIPLAWCGMWAGWVFGLVLVPLFGWACVRAVRQSQPLLLLYAAPAVFMLGMHAVLTNHYTRYNLILIGPFAVGAAWIISAWTPRVRWRSRALAPGP
jgi:4-amino-4-deoxy-L-arabinose transferase-like glycosyltransferase